MSVATELKPPKKREPIQCQRADYLFRWIASYQKSGNTWVRAFLSAYRAGNLDLDNLVNSSDFAGVLYQQVSAVPLASLQPWEYLLLRGAALLNLFYINNWQRNIRPLVKTHTARSSLFGTAFIPFQLTHSAAYIVRDPRDVAVSFALWCGEDLDVIIGRMGSRTVWATDSVAQPMGDWSTHVRSWEPKGSDVTAVVRYEDMITDPGAEFAKILKAFDEPLDEERFDEALRLTTFKALQQAEAENGFREHVGDGPRFFRNGVAGGWRDVLTRKQSEKIEHDHYEVMKDYGYL